jgi:hypothetical protein
MADTITPQNIDLFSQITLYLNKNMVGNVWDHHAGGNLDLRIGR